MELSNTFIVASRSTSPGPSCATSSASPPACPALVSPRSTGRSCRRGEGEGGPHQRPFKGTAEMAERDYDSHRAVIEAKGKDTGGKGNATPPSPPRPRVDGRHRVTIATDLSITGKVAQLGAAPSAQTSARAPRPVRRLPREPTCWPARRPARTWATTPRGPRGDQSDGGPRPSTRARPSRRRRLGNGSGPAPGPATAGAGSPVATAPTPPPGGMPPGTAATGGEAAAGTPGAPTATVASSGCSSAATGPAPASRGPEVEPIDLIDATAGGQAAKKAVGPVAAVMAMFFVIWWWRRRS